MSNFRVSPGLTITERDLTSVVSNSATTVGGFAGIFRWGPVEELTTVVSENDLVSKFGTPNDSTFASFFSAAAYLAYANNLKVVRVLGDGAYNAVYLEDQLSSSSSDEIDLLIKNATHYETSNISDEVLFSAKYPGRIGNGLHISICDDSTVFASTWVDSIGGVNYDQSREFNSAPGTSDYATGRGGTNDEMHIIIRDYDGSWTGSPGTVLEKFAYVSKASDARKSDGSSNYYVNVLNNTSRYIWWGNHPSAATTWGNNLSNGESGVFEVIGSLSGSLKHGADHGDTGVSTALASSTGFGLFAGADANDVKLIFVGEASAVTANYVIDNVVEVRKNCVAFVSPLREDVVNNPGSEVSDILDFVGDLNRSSYVVMDGNWKRVYDRYNDTFRYVPLNGDIAGLCANTDRVSYPWFSPAGVNRGRVKNVTRLAWNPTEADRDSLYRVGVNPVITIPGQGSVLFGDKTLLNRPSAFQAINVRRLFIALQDSISNLAQFQLFEFNDDFARSLFRTTVEPYLRTVQSERGITEFRVICDTSNNTPDVVDRREFIADIYVKPNKSTNFVHLRFVASGSGTNLEEIGS